MCRTYVFENSLKPKKRSFILLVILKKTVDVTYNFSLYKNAPDRNAFTGIDVSIKIHLPHHKLNETAANYYKI